MVYSSVMELLTGVPVAKMMPRPPVSSFMYSSNTSLIKRYIEPYLGNIKLKEIMARSLEKYYQTLLKAPATRRMTDRKNKNLTTTVTPSTIRKVHNLLRSAFNQAEKWDLIEKNCTLCNDSQAESETTGNIGCAYTF